MTPSNESLPLQPPLPSPLHQDDAVSAPEPVNEPPWDGAWTNVVPANPMGQSFIAKDPYVVSVDVEIVTGNLGQGGDHLILRIVSAEAEVLAETSMFVEEGFEGWLQFRFRERVRVARGSSYVIELQGSGKVAFGWKYGRNTYSGGSAVLLGKDRPDIDFFFRVNR